MIKVYGKTYCMNCEELKEKLKADGIEFEYTSDMNTLRKVGSVYRIMSAPIILIGEKAYSYLELQSDYKTLVGLEDTEKEEE